MRGRFFIGGHMAYTTSNKKFLKSPDNYDDAGKGDAPGRKSYSATPDNVTQRESPKRAGGIPSAVRKAEGTESPRADSKTKSARVPESGSGKSRIPSAVDSFDDTKDF